MPVAPAARNLAGNSCTRPAAARPRPASPPGAATATADGSPGARNWRCSTPGWGLLALYQTLRIAITDAVQAVPGTDPDRASCQIVTTDSGLPSRH